MQMLCFKVDTVVQSPYFSMHIFARLWQNKSCNEQVAINLWDHLVLATVAFAITMLVNHANLFMIENISTVSLCVCVMCMMLNTYRWVSMIVLLNKNTPLQQYMGCNCFNCHWGNACKVLKLIEKVWWTLSLFDGDGCLGGVWSSSW